MLRKSLILCKTENKKYNTEKSILKKDLDLKLEHSYQQNPSLLTPAKLKILLRLKNTEKRLLDEKSYRTKSHYKDNITASLALPTSKREIRIKRNDPKYLLDLSRDYIIEHAARRVDLFFYTLIAYYKKNSSITQGDTLFQHGLGRKTLSRVCLTQACHSSFFPAFVDETINRHAKIKSSSSHINTHLFKRSIISGTHFLDSLNSTIELPLFVNYFDGTLEGKISNPSACRKSSIEIIQLTSSGHITPIEGLREFFIVMNKAFSDISEKKPMSKSGPSYLERDSQSSPINIKNEILELQKIGTFSNKWRTVAQQVSEEYIEMLLRLTPEEKSKCTLTVKNKNEIYLKKIHEIQSEILNSKSSFGYSNNGRSY